MDSNLPEQGKSDSAHLSKATGCGIILLIVLISIWVAGLSALTLYVRWSVEQAMFESDAGVIDFRWGIQVIYAVLLYLPLVPIYFMVKAPRIKLMIRLWMIAGGFVVLSIPAKFLYLTSQNQSNILLSAALLLMSAILFLIRKPSAKRIDQKEKSGLLGTAVLAGLALSIPWLLWGALGSPLDTILVLALAGCVCLFVISSIYPFYLENTQALEGEVKIGEFLFDGFSIAVFLLIVVSGLGQNGSETLLALTVPAAGWLIVAFAAAGKNYQDHGKVAVGIISGLTVALPLLFFDMDELSQIITGAPGEVTQWAEQAGLYSLIYLMVITLVIVFFFKQIPKMRLQEKRDLILTGVSIVGFALIYIIFGQPGFYGDKLFVIFTEQVDTSAFATLNPLIERKTALYHELTETAKETQSDLRYQLDRWKIGYTPYYLVNGIEVNGGFLMREWLEKQPGVNRVLESPQLRPLPEELPTTSGEVSLPPEGTLWNLEMIHVPQVWEELGVTGKGIVIGQTDSGVEGSHPELKQSYRGEAGSNDYNWLDPWYGSYSPVDYGGHGTGTLSIEVGSTRGIARDAEWIGCVNLARNLGNPARYLDCMQFMFAPYPQGGSAFLDGDVSQGAMIVNNSWGCPRVEGCDSGVFEPAMKVLKTAGIFMSTSAGNSGYYGCSTITDPPAIYEDVFTAGSVDKVGQISEFSSLGPVTVDGSNRLKPDLLAPGEQILMADLGGTYTFSSGTSFSAPHVSGVVALMWSANPALIGDIDTTKRLLIETAQPFNGVEPNCGDANYGSGYGILDAYAAVKAAIALK